MSVCPTIAERTYKRKKINNNNNNYNCTIFRQKKTCN